MNSCDERNFKDSKSFMTTEDGRIAFCTPRKTWADIAKHGLLLDDYFFFQTHRPTILFDFKPPSYRFKKEKEGLNDEDRCESCKQPLDTITFQRKNEYGNEAVCSSCAYIGRINRLERIFNLTDLNNHLVKVENLLYQLSNNNRVSPKWILPRFAEVLYNWKIGTGRYHINTLRNISLNWYHLYDTDVIDVTNVVTILLMIRDELKLNIKSLN
jgi:hypothetical protein